MEWREFWDVFPRKHSEADFFRQVGKTFKGEPISRDNLVMIIEDIKRCISLSKEDIVLDLCCGNGIITKEIAKECNYVAGVDFSNPLISIAEKYNKQLNLDYINMSVLDIAQNDKIAARKYTKVYMYEALQHFEEDQFEPLLKVINSITDSNAVIFLASIPDIEKLWSFYNTPELRQDYYKRKQNGELLLGTWWDKQFIYNTCRKMQLECEFLEQPASFHTAYYRFDIKLSKI